VAEKKKKKPTPARLTKKALTYLTGPELRFLASIMGLSSTTLELYQQSKDDYWAGVIAKSKTQEFVDFDLTQPRIKNIAVGHKGKAAMRPFAYEYVLQLQAALRDKAEALPVWEQVLEQYKTDNPGFALPKPPENPEGDSEDAPETTEENDMSESGKTPRRGGARRGMRGAGGRGRARRGAAKTEEKVTEEAANEVVEETPTKTAAPETPAPTAGAPVDLGPIQEDIESLRALVSENGTSTADVKEHINLLGDMVEGKLSAISSQLDYLANAVVMIAGWATPEEEEEERLPTLDELDTMLAEQYQDD
jgi:hypothetical protein